MARELKYLDPNKLIIVGLDVDEEGSPLVDERAAWEVDDAMVKNIMVYGVLQPVSVRMEAGRVYVVDGRQRVKAARAAVLRQDEAGEVKAKVPCIEVTGDDSRVVGIMASANEIRKDDEVLVKAAKASRMLSLCGSKEEVALAFGRSTKTVENWMKLLQADPAIHEAIRDKKISAAVGITLASKSREEQIIALDEILKAANSPATSNSSADESKKPTKPSSSSSTRGSSDREHPGIKKGWLRKAMKTDVFENLAVEDQEILMWFLTGSAPKGHWLDDFTWQVDEELGKG